MRGALRRYQEAITLIGHPQRYAIPAPVLDVDPYVISIDWGLSFGGWSAVSVWTPPRRTHPGGARRRRAVVRKVRR